MKHYLAIIFFVSNIVFSQNNFKISGKVSDKSTGEGLIGASVYLDGGNNGTISDFEGNYEILNIESGIVKIICQYISYLNDTIEINLDNNLTVNFELISDSYTIDDVNLVTKVNRKDESYVVTVSYTHLTLPTN